MTSRRRRASLTRGFHEKPRSLSLPHLSRQYSERESRAPPTVPTALNTPRRTARHTARVHVKPARLAAVSDVGARRDERTTRTLVRETQSSSPSCGSARAADSMPSSSSATEFHVEHMRHPSPQCRQRCSVLLTARCPAAPSRIKSRPALSDGAVGPCFTGNKSGDGDELPRASPLPRHRRPQSVRRPPRTTGVLLAWCAPRRIHSFTCNVLPEASTNAASGEAEPNMSTPTRIAATLGRLAVAPKRLT